jgi:hypothetical protein
LNWPSDWGLISFRAIFYTPQVVENNDIDASQQFLLSIYAEVMKEDFNYSILEIYFKKT